MKAIGKLLAAEVIMICLGFVLLVFSYLIPKDAIENHVRESVKVFEEEGTYPQLVAGFVESQLDNWTDALMLLTAVYQDSENNVLRQAVLNKRSVIEGKNPAETLVSVYSQEETRDVIKSYSYGRYWHGYLLFLKPLLVFLNYGEIRYVNMTVQLGFMFYLIYLFVKHNKAYYGIPFLFYVLSINYVASAMSLQFSSILLLTMLSMVVLLLNKEHYLENTYLVVLHFLIVGCLTSYFDLLTYPLHTLAIPMILWLAISGKQRYKTAIKLVISWGNGYGGMWIGKWIWGSAVTGTNLFGDVLRQAKLRTGYTASERSFTYIDMMKRIFRAINHPILFMVLVAALLYILFCILRHSVEVDKGFMLLCFVIAVMPFCWYAIMGNHSYWHFWFTYRELSIPVFAVMMAAVSCLDCVKKRHMKAVGIKNEQNQIIEERCDQCDHSDL